MQSAIKQAVQAADSARPLADGASPAVSPATTTPEDFDRTQWENTRWKDECLQSSGGNTGTPAQTPNAESRAAGPTSTILREGTDMPGEELQQKEEHGQHLIAFPRTSVWLCIAELVLLLVGLVLVCVAREWKACTILSVCALGLDICIVGPTLFVLWKSKQVAHLERNGHEVHYVARKYKLGVSSPCEPVIFPRKI
ncbi:hypothetical protein AAVH_07820 [Aphelenchoides avenae]|nr:hypothetical protein AAVH_07820 [Aphelenchus avenae]